ncbi:unnamed protein product [Cuscuta campestris]|uniref:Uncharacterized protein n=1 Tax=Cuscuta campestris TaxID=132261 RepID=A0A484MKX4_9ASTE|nr:unnamed protein product [Cuscuta campestris]
MPPSDGKIFPSMGKQSLNETDFQNHAKQRWEVLPITVKALVQHYHKAECPYPAMGSFTHRWEPRKVFPFGLKSWSAVSPSKCIEARGTRVLRL